MSTTYLSISVLIAFSTPVYSQLVDKGFCAEKCNTEFGSLIGQSGRTKAFSNCSDDCVKDETNFVVMGNKKIACGMKWQCVEYARRWLIENKNITFPEVRYAYQIWALKNGERVETNERVPLLRFENRKSKTPPQVGDLLIYSPDFAITGHVAVIVSVNSNFICVAEQNYFNDFWDGVNYSRRLLLEKNPEGKYRIFDDSVMGWVRFDPS